MMLRDSEKLRAESKQIPQRYHIYISDRTAEYQRDSAKSFPHPSKKFALRTQVDIHKVTAHSVGGVINNPWVGALHGLEDFCPHTNYKITAIGQFLGSQSVVLDIAIAVVVITQVPPL